MTATTRTYVREREESGWTGWIAFGGIMLILLGLFSVIEGLVAVFDQQFYAVTRSGLVVTADLTVWGWVHFGMGAIAFAAGIGVLAGNKAARIAAAIIAGLSAIVHLAFIPAYPLWAIIIIALDVIVIYALIAHGDELKPPAKMDL